MENNKNIKPSASHMININNRAKMDITGVTKVITFNENIIILITSMGTLNIKGKDMKMHKLNVDVGDMSVEGEIDSLVYSNNQNSNKENFLKKLFK